MHRDPGRIAVWGGVNVRSILVLLLLVAAAGCGRNPPPTAPSGEANVASRAGPIFNEAFADGFEIPVKGALVRFRSQSVGEIRITSGKLVACDPLVNCGTPFVGTVPVGTFPLHLAIATIGNDERIGLAKIVFGSGSIASWKLAVTAGQDLSTLKKGEFFGYGVDSGTGAFMDVEAFRAYDAERNRVGEKFDDRLFAELDKTYKHTRSWYLHQTDKGTVAMFSSGYGDGAYPTYWAYDAAGKLVAVITDFGVVPWK